MRLEMSWWGSHEVVKELTEPTYLITFHGWQFFKYCGGVRLKKKYCCLQEMGVYAVYDTSERLQYIGLSRTDPLWVGMGIRIVSRICCTKRNHPNTDFVHSANVVDFGKGNSRSEARVPAPLLEFWVGCSEVLSS